MFRGYELETLQRYTKGDIIKDEDRKILHRLSAIGMVRL